MKKISLILGLLIVVTMMVGIASAAAPYSIYIGDPVNPVINEKFTVPVYISYADKLVALDVESTLRESCYDDSKVTVVINETATKTTTMANRPESTMRFNPAMGIIIWAGTSGPNSYSTDVPEPIGYFDITPKVALEDIEIKMCLTEIVRDYITINSVNGGIVTDQYEGKTLVFQANPVPTDPTVDAPVFSGITSTSATAVVNFTRGWSDVTAGDITLSITGGSGSPQAVVASVQEINKTTDKYNATIDISGLVTGQTYSVTATVKNKAGFTATGSAANLAPRTPTSIVINNAPAANVTDLESGSLTATITYSDSGTETTSAVLWSSGAADVVSITGEGAWTARKGGTAVITAKVNDNNVDVRTTATINVNSTPANITISGLTASLNQDDTGTATAVVKDKNNAVITAQVTWASNDSSIITIDAGTGAWTTAAKGTAKITATAVAGGVTKQQDFVVNVVKIPKTVEISGIPADLRIGGTAQLTATVKDDEGNIIVPDTTVWTSKNTGIFTVSTTGLITAVAPGTANISVSATALETTVTNETPVTVKPNAGVVIDQPAHGTEHKAGTPVQFNATPLGLDNIAGYLWTFGDGNTASDRNVTHTYDEITGIGAKTINLTVTYDGSKTVSQEIGITLIKNTSRPVSLEITAAPEYIYAGKTGTLGATVKDQYGANMQTGATVQWTSGNSGVLSISDSTWTSVAAGTTTITATVAENTSVTASRTVEVVAPATVGAVIITGTPEKMSIGTATTLTALVLDQNSAVMPNEAVDWTSSNTAAVTVGTDGTIRAVGAGSATITATSKSSPSTSAGVPVIVVPGPSPVLTSVTITGAAQNLYIGDTLPLGILALDQDSAVYTPSPSVTWASGDEGVLTVAADGTVIAVADGITTITATADGGITDQVTITVSATPRPATQTLTSVAVTPSTVTLYPQKTAEISAVALDENTTLFTNETVTWTWTSDDESVATVSATGTITAQAVGSATITATARTDSGAEQSGTVAVTVKTPPAGPDQTPAKVTISGAATLTVLEGTGGTLKAVVLNSDDIFLPDETVTWSSSSDTIVIIDATAGTYRAKSVGTATVTATSATNQMLTATIDFTVKRNPDLRTPSGITISAPSSLTIGQTGTASAVVTDQYGSPLTGETILWSSSTAAVADVSAAGVITAKSAGTASITAKVQDYESVNASQTITVTDTPGPVPPSGGGDGSSGGYSGSVTATISSTGVVDFGMSTGITGVSFAKGTTGTVVLETKPTGITGPAKTHSVADIKAPSFEGSAEISFAVPVAVLRDQGLSVNDVVLRHYTNGEWVNLPTFFVGEDHGAAKYVAQTTGFSPFAIVYEKSGAQTVERSTPQPTKDTGSSVTAKPTASKTSEPTSATAAPTESAIPGGATAVPTMTQAPAPVAGVLLGLLAAAGVVIRRRE